MNKQDIIRLLNDFPYDHKEYWVITGAAMVLHGFKDQTRDIDLGCSRKLADRLEADGYFHATTEDGLRWFKVGKDIEIFEDWLYDGVTRAESIPVITPKGLIQMKQSLGRKKDLADIRLIKKHCQIYIK